MEADTDEASSSVLNGETLAPFRSASRKDLPARSSRHARAKSVGAFAMQVARLIGALHAQTRREIFAKTSTWWAKKKAGKGTQHARECQGAGFALFANARWRSCG